MPDARVWVVTSEDVYGLLTDAAVGLVTVLAVLAVVLLGFSLLSRIAR